MTLTRIFAKVLNMSLTASLVIVLVIAARFVLRKSPKVFSYALWAVVLFRLLCPVSLPSPVSLLGLLDAPVAQTEGITTTVEYLPYKVVETAAENPQIDRLPQNPAAQTPAQSQQTTVETKRNPLSAAEIVTYIWLAGIAVMVIAGVGSCLRFRRHLTVAVQVRDNIYLVDHIDSAFVAGLICPKVYLPSDIPLKQMGYIIAHEQYHIRRLDHVTKHLSFAALCIHWFNPFVWIAFILSGKDLEMSCDEAVIKKLGEGIRADYSASLLSLATGRRIIAGTPLAFGEGDTKSRIKNMAKWKQPKKWVSIVSFILCFTILTACAANPTQPVVVSKNDGSFDTNVIQPAAEDPAVGSAEPVVYTDEFTSTDKSVTFTYNINYQLPAMDNPVVEVVPHFLTAEDAKRVATALLEDADWYEGQILTAPEYTKEEILEKINRWSQYTNTELVSELYARESEYTDSVINTVKGFIERYSDLYESAPSGAPKACEWTFKKLSHYFDPPEALAGKDLSDDDDAIQAVAKVGDLEYSYRVWTRNQSDYKINTISISLGGEFSPHGIDSAIYQARLCRTEKPTEENVAAAVTKAEKMLAGMDLGQWKVDTSSVLTTFYGDIPEYMINVTAVPVFNGAPAVREPQIQNVKSDVPYASHYFLADVYFQFSANADLVSFHMDAPVDIKEVVNENVAAKSLDELMELAKNHLTLSDCYEYGLSAENIDGALENYGENLNCHVDLSQMEYGLLRVKVPNTDDSYYYVPGIVLSGSVDYLGSKTGTVYQPLERWHFNTGYSRIYPIIALNAVDGSIVEIDY